MKKNVITSLILSLIFALTGCMNAGDKDFKYWELGVGSYGAGADKFDTWSGMTALDRARMDWIYLTFGNPPGPSKETTELLNSFLKINPDLKIMVRLWPLVYKRYKGDKRHKPASFLDYLYEKGIKEKMLKKIDHQVDSVMKYIDKKEAVYGFTFTEELPDHFSDRGFNIIDPGTLPRDMKRYRGKYKKETGKKLNKWNGDARTWYAQKMVKALNDINAYIKKKSGGKKVFIYFATHYRTLDWVEKGEDVNQWRIMPIYWKDMIKPGVADGFFVYINNKLWTKRYTDLAQKYNWPYFSQLSQSSGMRLESWEKCLKMAKKKIPQNLGYFLYVTGNDKTGLWNDNPGLTDNNNLGRASIRQNTRAICAKEKIGMDVLNRELRPKLQVQHNLGKVKKGGWGKIRLHIENPHDASWYGDLKQAILKNVKIKLDIPKGFILPESNSVPSEIVVGDLSSRKTSGVLWYLKKINAKPYDEKKGFKITVTTANSLPAVIVNNQTESFFNIPESYSIKVSGESWLYPGFKLKSNKQPMIITLKSTASCASRPTIAATGAYGVNCKIIWNACLRKGQKLVLGPGLKAILYENNDKKGKDVSDKLLGTPVLFGRCWNKITYSDDDLPLGGEKLKITIKPFTAKKK